MKTIVFLIYIIFNFPTNNKIEAVGKKEQIEMVYKLTRVMNKFTNRKLEYQNDIEKCENNEFGSFFRAQRNSRVSECEEIVKDLNKIIKETKEEENKNELS